MKVYLHVNGASSDCIGCIGCEKSLRPAQQVWNDLSLTIRDKNGLLILWNLACGDSKEVIKNAIKG